jgi:hypothetical protein
VLCSIASTEKMKPSYYHSFGESIGEGSCTGLCLNAAASERSVLTSIILIIYKSIMIMRPGLR